MRTVSGSAYWLGRYRKDETNKYHEKRAIEALISENQVPYGIHNRVNFTGEPNAHHKPGVEYIVIAFTLSPANELWVVLNLEGWLSSCKWDEVQICN